VITVKIDYYPVKFRNYFQWLLLGLMELSNKQIITFEFSEVGVIGRGLQRLKAKFSADKRYCIEGRICHQGQELRFAYDISDTPFLFDQKVLDRVDYYFKAQYPKDIASGHFTLSEVFDYQYPDQVMENLEKIKPALLGTRHLGKSLKYLDMLGYYRNLVSSTSDIKSKKCFIYFGSDNFPESIDSSSYDDEGYFFSQLKAPSQHPNIMRGWFVNHFKDDCRFSCFLLNKHIGDEIAFDNFHQTVALHYYNLNISGYRMSLPNRFMDSFVVNTAVLTDNLSVQWYVDFSEYVFEFGEIGYSKQTDSSKQALVNTINQQLDSIEYDNKKLTRFYQDYLAPEAFARYVIEATISKVL